MAWPPATSKSYLITILANSHQTFVKMCLREMHISTGNGRCRWNVDVKKKSRKTLWGVSLPSSHLKLYVKLFEINNYVVQTSNNGMYALNIPTKHTERVKTNYLKREQENERGGPMLSVCERSFYAEEMLCSLKDSVSHVWGSFVGPMTPGQLALYKQLALFTLLSIKSRFTLALITSVSIDACCSIFTWAVNTLVDVWEHEINPNESD